MSASKFDISLNVRVGKDQQRALSALMREMQQVTKAETPKIIRNTGRDFSRLAVKRTPVVKKTVPVRVFVVRDKRTGKPVLRDGKFIYYRQKKAGRITPGGRGFAKSGWVKAMLGLGLFPKAGLAGFTGSKSLQFGHFRDGLKQREPFVEIGNKIPYIEELDRGSSHNPAHHILSSAFRLTVEKTEQRLENAAKVYERRWSRGLRKR